MGGTCQITLLVIYTRLVPLILYVPLKPVYLNHFKTSEIMFKFCRHNCLFLKPKIIFYFTWRIVEIFSQLVGMVSMHLGDWPFLSSDSWLMKRKEKMVGRRTPAPLYNTLNSIDSESRTCKLVFATLVFGCGRLLFIWVNRLHGPPRFVL